MKVPKFMRDWRRGAPEHDGNVSDTGICSDAFAASHPQGGGAPTFRSQIGLAKVWNTVDRSPFGNGHYCDDHSQLEWLGGRPG